MCASVDLDHCVILNFNSVSRNDRCLCVCVCVFVCVCGYGVCTCVCVF